MPDLTLMEIARRYSTEDAAREYFERVRWPDGPVCPHCGNCDPERVHRIAANHDAKVRAGLIVCAECRKQFSVTVGTVMEDTHLPLSKWLLAWYVMCASKTQVSALQLQRQLEIGSYRSAWHMCHRIRFALGGEPDPGGKLMRGTVEADEMYVGGKRSGKGRGYKGNKAAVVSLVERGGRVRSVVMQQPIEREALRDHLLATLNTDESPLYTRTGIHFALHRTVNHSRDEYSYVDRLAGRVTTNTVEGFFGNAKRSLDGTHHHVSEKHLPLYLAEIDHKYNTRKASDGDRTDDGIRKVEGKRLTLRGLKGAA